MSVIEDPITEAIVKVKKDNSHQKCMSKLDCECGGRYMLKSRKAHFKTDKHKRWVDSGEVTPFCVVKNMTVLSFANLTLEEQKAKKEYMKKAADRYIIKRAAKLLATQNNIDQ
jgi:hypothetical protein